MTTYIVPPSDVNAREIPGYPGYWATDDGRIWSGRRGGVWKKPYSDYGYSTVRMGTMNGKVRPASRVHRLVALAFLGTSTLPYVRHLNGNKADNRLANLAYGKPSDNVDDEVRLGRTRSGLRSPTAKLSYSEVRETIALLAMGHAYGRLAKKYGVAKAAIRSIALGRSYKSVSRAPFDPASFRRQRCISRHYIRRRTYMPE